MSKEADPASRSEATRREEDLLAVLAELSTLPVPEPVFADAEAGVIAYFKLRGIPLIDHPVAEPTRLAPALGQFLGGLHRAPLEEVEKLVEQDTYPHVPPCTGTTDPAFVSGVGSRADRRIG